MTKISGRIEKSFLNIVTAIFGQMFSFILSFVIRTVFIKTLGDSYLGLNGLFSNLLSVLNLTELGFGTAIVIELYRTVERNDNEKTNQYLQFYKKAYYIIGLSILVIGLVIIPFLHYFINDIESVKMINYKLIFIFYLINTTFSYFFFAYRISIIIANQAEYKIRVITYIFKTIEMTLQIIFLLLYKNIYFYLIIPIILGCICELIKGIFIGKWYPYIKIKPQSRLSKQELRVTFRNIFSVALYKISGVIMTSSNNILISSFISIIVTGLYSNYVILVASIDTILYKVFSAFTASIGNLNITAEKDINKKYQIFKTISFMNFWVYGFCSACFIVLFHPFIKIWLNENYLLNQFTEYIIVFNFLIAGLQETVATHRAAYGLFYKGRYRPIFSIIINVVSSIVFVRILPAEFGIVGILLGSILSNLAVSWWFDAYIVHKYAFKRSPKSFYVTFWWRVLYVSVNCLTLKWICWYVSISPEWNVIISLLICVIMYNGIFILCFHRKDEFQYLWKSGSYLISRRKTAKYS